MTVPIDPEKVGELFALIAKGLLWHHWQVLLRPDKFGVRAELQVHSSHLSLRILESATTAATSQRVTGQNS